MTGVKYLATRARLKQKSDALRPGDRIEVGFMDGRYYPELYIQLQVSEQCIFIYFCHTAELFERFGDLIGIGLTHKLA